MKTSLLVLLVLAFGLQANANIAARMERVSSKLMGAKYLKDGPLGEGRTGEFDRDPLLRIDGFDCTTFIETVISAARSKNASEMIFMMNQIRYKDGIVSFQTRNHFPGVDWIKNNSKNGMVRDITENVAGEKTQIAQALIERDEWYRHLGLPILSGVPEEEKPKLLAELHAMGDQYGKEIEEIPYVKSADLLADPSLAKKIPNGSVINLVRPGWDLRAIIGTQLNISHQGLAFWRDGVLYMRHASTTGTVKESNLLDYLRDSKSVAGINVLQVLETNRKLKKKLKNFIKETMFSTRY